MWGMAETKSGIVPLCKQLILDCKPCEMTREGLANQETLR